MNALKAKLEKMIAYKLVRKMKDGSLSPLFINKKLRFELGEWHQAEDHPTSGFAHRPGFHCCLKPEAPHLKEDAKSGDRIWIEAEVEDYEIYNRPKSQGGKWVLAQRMKPIRTLGLNQLQQHIGKRRTVAIGGEYKVRGESILKTGTIHFVGVNAVGHKVITFKEDYSIYYLANFNEIKIQS